MLKLWAFLTGRKIVYLKDYQGEVYKTIEQKRNAFGERWCFVYPFTEVGFVTLKDDGSTGGGFYIEKWRYAP